MDVLSLLMNPAVAPFSGALAVVLLVFVVELALTLLAGSGFSDLVSALVHPDSLPDTTFTNWLLVREMPLLMALLTFVTGFGGGGLLAQATALQFLEAGLPMPLAYLLAVITGLLSIRAIAGVLTKLRLVHTSALPPEAFIGQIATLSSPEARPGYCGAASFTDRYNQVHHVMVEPEEPHQVFTAGERVRLTRRVNDSLFHASKAP